MKRKVHVDLDQDVIDYFTRRGDIQKDASGRIYGFNAWLKRMKRRGE